MTGLHGTNIDIPNSAYVFYSNAAAQNSETILSLDQLLTCDEAALIFGMVHQDRSLLHECLTLDRLTLFHDAPILIKVILKKYPNLEHVCNRARASDAQHTPLAHFLDHWMMIMVMGCITFQKGVDEARQQRREQIMCRDILHVLVMLLHHLDLFS